MLFGTHNRLPSYLQRNLGWARGAAGGRPPPWARHHIPGLFPSPSGPPPRGHPGVRRGAGTARGPHLPCSAPRARRALPDTQERTRGSGKRGRSSTLEERETLWLQQHRCRLPQAPQPRLHQRHSRNAGCQHALGCRRRCQRSCRQLIPHDMRISFSPPLSPPAPSSAQ